MCRNCASLAVLPRTSSARADRGPRQPAGTAPAVPAAQVISPGKSRGINEVKQAFSSELAGMLLFEESASFVIVKPRRFLGSDNFAQIASIVRELGGEYVSAGRNSHFKIAK